MRRCLIVLVGACLVSVVAAGPAPAKLPPFRLEVSPRVVVVGEPVELTATVDDASSWPRGATLGEALVEVFRTEDLPTEPTDPATSPGLFGGRPVDFSETRRGVFHATLTFDEPGSYQIVAMDIWNMTVPGYPGPVEITVRAASPPTKPQAAPPPAHRATSGGHDRSGAVLGTGIGAGALVLLLLVRWVRASDELRRHPLRRVRRRGRHHARPT